jgi:lysozyme
MVPGPVVGVNGLKRIKACHLDMRYRTSQAGMKLIKSFEGLKLRAYPDPASGGAPWTIGFGTTKDVLPGMIITRAQAEALLRRDLSRIEREVNRLVKVEINQNMFDALVSFAYNLGIGSLKRSTLLKKLNQGDLRGAADQLLRWNRARGRTMAGLTRRREAERDLFLA